MRIKLILPGVVLLASIYFLNSCGTKNQEMQMPTLELPVAKVSQGNGFVVKEYPASVEGITDIEIRPQVSGYLQKIYIDEGQFVKAGQPLFKIDDRVYQEQYNTAKASWASAKANLTNASIDLERRKEMVKEKLVSEIQVQQAQATYDAAVAAVQQAKAGMEAALVNLNFSVIKAPVGGYLGRINFKLGSLLGPSNPLPITTLSDNHQVNVYFSMSETDLMQFEKDNKGKNIQESIHNAAPVKLNFANGEIYPLEGKIDAIDGSFNELTGSITLRARFENPEGILRSGNTGKILIEKRYNDVILLPIASTINIQDKTYLFSIDKDNKVLQLPIEVMGKSGTDYIVSSGIKVGDPYIVSGIERIRPGMPIIPTKGDGQTAEKTTNKVDTIKDVSTETTH